jgi:hypothetical protein
LRKQELQRRASRKQARWETRRARHVSRPRQARKRRTRLGVPARVASPATRVTRIATAGARVDTGWGLPACRARLRPSSSGGVRGSESGTGPLIRGASAGTSRKGRLHPVTASHEGNLAASQPLHRGSVDRGSVGSRSCSRIAHRMQTSEGSFLGSSQEQASRKRVSGIAGGRGRSPPMEGALVRAGGPSLTRRVAEADLVVLLVGITTEGVRNRLAPLPPAEHAGGERKRERRPGRTCDHRSYRSGRSWSPGDRGHVRCTVEAGGSPSSEALPGGTFTRSGRIQAIRRVLV